MPYQRQAAFGFVEGSAVRKEVERIVEEDVRHRPIEGRRRPTWT
jgi:hypothetical protein